MSLPWERVPEEVTSRVESETPVVQDSAPTTQQPSDFTEAIGRATEEALSQLMPVIQKQALEYAKDYAMGKLLGRRVDGFPTITTLNKEGREVVIADAKNRSLRTFVQGLGVDILFALVGLLSMLANMDVLDKTAWVAFGALVAKTVVQTIASYVMRLKVSPSGTVEGARVSLESIAVPKHL